MKSKQEFRQELKEWYAALPEEENRRRSESIRKRILKEKLFREAETVFCYISVNDEPDTRQLLKDILHSGKRLLVPRCIDEGIMEAVEIQSTDELIPGKYGIPEPPENRAADNPENIDIMIIPAMAVNRRKYRIGKGKGYYDRFSLCTKAGRWIVTFMEVEFNEEEFDVAGDVIFAEV